MPPTASSTHTPTTSTDTNTASSTDTRHGSIAARVTAHIRDALHNGVRPWVQPWSTATALALPLRHNGVPYKGINVLALWCAAQTHGFTARYWLTFRQALALGGAVRRGERGQPIIFYSGGAPADDDASTTADATTTASPPKRAILRSYVVFNADQIDGLPAHFLTPPCSPPTDNDDDLSARLDPAFNAVPAVITHGGARACYDPTTDTIHLPPRHSFISSTQYFSTLAHELAHWTGHPTRLARDAFTANPRTPTAYAREELVAELTSAFLGAELHLPVDHLEDHAAYLDHWLALLDHDPGALLSAAGHAQRAADFLRPFLCPESTPPAVAPSA